MNLFIKQDIVLHSGQKSDFKIDCDALTDNDLETIAYIISETIPIHSFSKVVGVPHGGIRLANALEKYKENSSKATLIVDDVLTTGGSMEKMKSIVKADDSEVIFGAVIFARSECPSWIWPVFKMKSLKGD